MTEVMHHQVVLVAGRKGSVAKGGNSKFIFKDIKLRQSF